MQHKPRAEALSGVCTSNVRELYGVGLVTEALQSSRVRTHINSCRARRSLGDSSPPLTDVSLLRAEASRTWASRVGAVPPDRAPGSEAILRPFLWTVSACDLGSWAEPRSLGMRVPGTSS